MKRPFQYLIFEVEKIKKRIYEMVSASTLLKKFADVNHSVIDSYEFTQNSNGEDILKVTAQNHY